jgi:hypothetical protein
MNIECTSLISPSHHRVGPMSQIWLLRDTGKFNPAMDVSLRPPLNDTRIEKMTHQTTTNQTTIVKICEASGGARELFEN